MKLLPIILLLFALLLSINSQKNLDNSPKNIERINSLKRINDFKQSAFLIPALSFSFHKVEKDLLALYPQNKLGKFIPISGNLEQLKYFFNALKNSKNKKVRIAHYGDSLIMGDLITSTLREKLQDNFSGVGVGYLPIVSDDYRMRRTIYQTSSNDWDYASFITRNAEKLPYGINGTVAVPKYGSWVKYEVTLAYKSVRSFDIFKLFYNNADKSSTIQISFDNGTTKKINLESGDDIKELSINVKDSKKVELLFLSGRKPYFYGVSLESSKGIYIDNFSMRGNSGVALLEINPKVIQECNNYLNYNLIILNYGANVSSPNKGIFTLYENKMITVIQEFQKIFPSTSFLLVSVADKTIKRGSQFITDPDVIMLLESQKRIAERTGIAFWNLWEAMGGNNSMNTWVNAAPPQALKDYAHFTQEGADRVGELFYESIIDAYQKYSK